MAEADPQRRHFTRIPFDADYRLHSTDHKQQWQGVVIDLSLHGALIQRPKDIQVARGDDFILELVLNAENIAVQMQVRVAHSQDSMIGLECEHIDLESMSHLRRILELNLGDEHLLEREINEIIQLNSN